MKVSLDTTSLPPVEFCGESYLIAVLQKMNGLQILQYGLLSIPIKIECNEQYTDLGLSLGIPEIDTVINLESDQQYMKVVQNFQITKISENEYTLPNNLQFSIVNNANHTFKQRCGIFSLQIISFIIPYNGSEELPIGNDRKEFDDLLKPYGKLLQFSISAVMVNNGKNLINNKFSQCSPQIQPNEKLAIDLKYFKLNKLITNELLEFSQLVVIIDPLNTIDDQNLKNNVFVLPLHLPNSKGMKSIFFFFFYYLRFNLVYKTVFFKNFPIILDLKEHDCIVESDPFSNGNKAVIIHNNYKSGVTKSYSYNNFTKTLAEKEVNNSMQMITKFFWQNWIINRRVDQLLSGSECPKFLLPKSIVEQFTDFLLNARMSISRVSAQNNWQKIQTKKLFYLLKTTRNSIKQFRSGSLSFYWNEVLISLRNSLRHVDGDSKLNVQFVFDIIRDIVSNENPKFNETQIFVTNRIQKFISRLSNDGINATIDTIPELKNNMNYVEELYLVFKWIRENSLLTFDLPEEIKVMIIESINNPHVNVSVSLQKILKLNQSYSKNDQINETRKESIDLLINLLKSSLDLGVWNSWLELIDKWNQIIKSNSYLILINGEQDRNGDHSNDQQLFCKQEALKQLLLWEAIPDWLNIDYEIENNPSVNTIDIEFRSRLNLIERSDFDPITGDKFWSIICMCECSSTRFCSNNL